MKIIHNIDKKETVKRLKKSIQHKQITPKNLTPMNK